ncbi:myosin heavy subunit [Bacillus sp. RC55]|uniref:coiled-coil domain-containing protein n=1 Tax=Bacillus sp. RC55 TaxID=3156292 RepID=UPI00383436A7
MKNKKLICLALPIMLSGIGCSNNDIEKEKKTETRSDKDVIKSLNNEVDKLRKEKDELEKKLQDEKASKEKGSKEKDELEKKIQDEEASKEKDVIKKDDKVEDLKRFSNLKEYQEAVYKLANKFESELRATKPIIEKDKTLLTNKDELKAQYDRVQVQADKIKSLHPPQEYTDLQIGLIDSLIVYQKAVDGMFSGLDVRDKEKVKGYEQSVIDGLTYFNDSLNAIKEIKE